MRIKNILVCFIYLALTLIGTSLIKIGAQGKESDIALCGMNFGLKFILGIFFYGCSFLMYTFVISKMQISLVIPILAALNSCAVVIIGMLLFGEKLNAGQLVGIGIVMCGVFWIGYYTK